MMTGISWGAYADYYGEGDAFKAGEVQTTKSGELRMHHPGVGYNVPTPGYVAYIKSVVEPAVDLGVQAIYLEEPEFWANTGWSEGFKDAWEAEYDESWQPPDASPDAQWRASKLKYELNFRALREVFDHIKARAAAQGRTIGCHVPTHSLINYAHWRIVSPMAHLMDLPSCDGYIAQVWTGTARTPNRYRGDLRERTFETAFLEYGQMLAMVRPTGRKVWFLADPIEDNPGYSWNNYRDNYLRTVIASLLWPDVHRYEVMPWPQRIFLGRFPVAGSGDKEPMPADYATQLLLIINALNHMDQPDVTWQTGSRDIGILVSDTMMFQRAAPHASEPHMGSFYGLALPLVKAGIPLAPVQMETLPHDATLADYRVLLLTYENQKPLRPAYHEVLAQWGRDGGALIYCGDGADPYHGVRAWWNDEGRTGARAYEPLLEDLGVDYAAAAEGPVAVGDGCVRVLATSPAALSERADGPEVVRNAVAEAREALGARFETTNHLMVRRGPYVVASVLEESVSDAPLVIEGTYLDLTDHRLPIVTDPRLEVDERVLLYDLSRAPEGQTPQVLASACRVRDLRHEPGSLTLTTRGPLGTHAVMAIALPGPPEAVRVDGEPTDDYDWEAGASLLRLRYPNQGADRIVEIRLPGAATG
jgi:hypothetical protein